MVKSSQKQNGSAHVLIVIILVVALIGTLGFVFWQNLTRNEAAETKTETEVATKTQTQEPTVPNTWPKFNDNTLGLNFNYPDSWGKAKLEVMNPKPDDLNKTFYKISFDNTNYILLIKPKASQQAFDTTVANLKQSIKDYPESRHVLVNESDHVAIVVPSAGNQDSELYAAKLVALPNIDADTVVLTGFKLYGSSVSCEADTYLNCYSSDEQSDVKLFLQELNTE